MSSRNTAQRRMSPIIDGLRALAPQSELRGSFWLTRIVFLRFIGFIYCVAFLVAALQNDGLIGPSGLLPARTYMSQVKQQLEGLPWYQRVAEVPSIFLFIECSSLNLALVAWAGVALSVVLVVVGGGPCWLMAALWGLYHSIVNVGQRWYSFGWESQLLESGFLAIFLCPLAWGFTRLPSSWPTPLVCIWGYRWLIFRIMLGAGLIKLRGDPCWRDLTCMEYHYQTQPVPNPVSWYLHHNPQEFHWAETLVNHIVECCLSFNLLIPLRQCRLLGGAVQILFQMMLIVSGNLSFLNWLTILPAIFCFDDLSLSFLFPKATVDRVRQLTSGKSPPPPPPLPAMPSAKSSHTHSTHASGDEHPPGPASDPTAFSVTPTGQLRQRRRTTAAGREDSTNGGAHETPPEADAKKTTTDKQRKSREQQQQQGGGRAVKGRAGEKRRPGAAVWLVAVSVLRTCVEVGVFVLLFKLSRPVVQNLISSRQMMNTSFDRFRLVNTYGAFGSVTKQRTEVIFEGTNATRPDDPEAVWQEYGFICKPGRVDRRPCIISPYHYRLDWLMWFAAFSSYKQHPWLVHLGYKLLKNEKAVLRLMAHNPFPDQPPTFVRASHYKYRYTKPKETGWFGKGDWWHRRYKGEYLPPVSVDDPALVHFVERNKWA
ncbi:unnamed protein product [Vitrella brassicaformis CCMP3155]|uniref:Lipase maturation factor n=1 Tax=Vitrella brassicaformis (strain CCMP3155) TaxID=1169540 RepID=A0A0G4GBJ8_VITBC|nr:unnamed protein product [Vitrella brassicaformis CCMP3155]|mmetsp:Transcript_13370/g.38531  ORF Transcript_13370/g.38531 Transcript_13370/m.38531 type:complete len:653 (+) Transcript_13370:208-2166(+)|eukprot:CEM26377.1 unnamed protein product [Vitrella brassicaformis CCMP3155]